MIARGEGDPYWIGVPVIALVRLLVVLALLLAPFGMSGRHGGALAAPTPTGHHAEAPDGHCAGEKSEKPGDKRSASADCAIACSAMPETGGALEASATIRPAYADAPATFFAGTAPGSDPPPPRLS